MQSAAQQASTDAPLTWLAFEPNAAGTFELTLRQWPGGQRQVLATGHPHGAWVQPA